MLKLVVFAAILALAAAAPEPGILGAAALTAYAPAAAVHSVPVISTGYQVAYSVAPVEQHGYKIVY